LFSVIGEMIMLTQIENPIFTLGGATLLYIRWLIISFILSQDVSADVVFASCKPAVEFAPLYFLERT